MRIVRKISFIYSSSIAYTIELGNLYARFFYGDSVLLDGSGNEVVIETPYTTAELFQIQYHQVADVMRLVHPKHKPATLSRTTPTTFVLEEIPFRDGPFLTRNDLIDPTNTSPATMTYTGALTAGTTGAALVCSVDWFLAGHVGCLFKLVHDKETKELKQSGPGTSATPMRTKGMWRFVTTGNWAGTIRIQRNENGAGYEDIRVFTGLTVGARNVSENDTEEADNVLFRMTADAGMTADFGATISLVDYYQEGIVQVTSVTDTKNAVVTVLSDIAVSALATRKWAEGAWSAVSGYPSAITFYKDRCVYAGDTGRVEL
jgi:hypothetical protein